jgi:hypothetical protein
MQHRSPELPVATRLIETKTHSAHPNLSVARSALKLMFRKEGEYWAIGYSANVFRLKDSKGLAYIAYLLRNPGTEFHALDVVGGIAMHNQQGQSNLSTQLLPHGDEHLDRAGISIGNQGDAGEMPDEQAKAAYRCRLSELREELEEAKELGKVERAERAEKEMDALAKELSVSADEIPVVVRHPGPVHEDERDFTGAAELIKQLDAVKIYRCHAISAAVPRLP